MLASPNRVVALATPLIFAPLAGGVTAWAAKHAPGIHIDQGQLQAIFIAGATIALAHSGMWMKGWQDYEKRQELLPAGALEPAGAAAGAGEPDLAPDTDVDIDPDIDPDALASDFDEDDDDPIAQLEAALAATFAGAAQDAEA
ncbi:MAG: hypothetical protein QOD69_664 [Solirubrobacteraceae bacterium]|jgi:hypothetical protein|nr:hypothetical protein [Solirubrobacteraceae bacterium]